MRDLRRHNGGFSLRDGYGFPIVTPDNKKKVKTLHKINIPNELAHEIIMALGWIKKHDELRNSFKKILAEYDIV